jgi:peptidoglycan/LPS O-acetylase OafA/YrhL
VLTVGAMYAQRDNIPALDGVRALAALAVVHGHLPDWATFMPTAWGGLAVNVFFCLSGFLITRGLLANRGTEGALWEFWKRRALRILPPMFIVIAIFAIVRPDWGTFAAGTYWYNFYAPYDHTLHPLRHTWSLALEEQFYAIWPLIVLFMPERRALGIIVLAIIVPAVLVIVYQFASQTEWRNEVIFRWTPFQVCYLATGGLIAIFEYEVRSRPVRFLLVGALSTAAGGLIYHFPLLHAGPQYWFWVMLTAPGLFLVALSFAALEGFGNAVLSFAPLTAIGRTSYGLYLYHLPIFWAFNTEAAQNWTPIVLAILLTIVAVSISWVFVEKPALRLKSAKVRRAVEAASN